MVGKPRTCGVPTYQKVGCGATTKGLNSVLRAECAVRGSTQGVGRNWGVASTKRRRPLTFKPAPPFFLAWMESLGPVESKTVGVVGCSGLESLQAVTCAPGTYLSGGRGGVGQPAQNAVDPLLLGQPRRSFWHGWKAQDLWSPHASKSWVWRNNKGSKQCPTC